MQKKRGVIAAKRFQNVEFRKSNFLVKSLDLRRIENECRWIGHENRTSEKERV